MNSQAQQPTASQNSPRLDSTATDTTTPNHDDGAIKDLPSMPETTEAKRSSTKTVLLMVSVLLSMFLVALDRTIISTAVPQITDDFNSITDVGWYGSAYLLTCCALQLLFGKLYTFFSIKGTFLVSVVLFEASSALCGAAPNSVAFIVGRAFAGVGAAGIFAGVIVCIVHIVPLHRRPQIQGMFGALMGIASIAGPLIGGGFTSNVTWRWCFYINLPIGGVAMVIIFLFLDIPNRDTTKLPLIDKLKQLDAPGTSLLVPGIVCLLLALQWGGQTYIWSNGRIIALFTLAAVLLIGFAAVQVWLPKTATLPPRIFKQRSVLAGLWATLTIQCGNYIVIYFLPIWFQSVKGSSAAQSGIQTLPLMLSMVLGSISGGLINTRIGYYTPLAIIGTCIMTVGAGLLTTLEVDTDTGKWIGYQILFGLGLGLSFQVPNLAAQTCLPMNDVPTGLALMLFGTLIGAAVFVAVGDNVLTNQLIQRLAWLPGFHPSLITSGGVTSLIDSLAPELRQQALVAYNEALRQVFVVGLIPAALSVLGAVSLEWKSIKKPSEAKTAAKDSEAAEEKKVVGNTA